MSNNVFNIPKVANTSEKSGILGELLFSGALVLATYVTLLFIEILYKYLNRLSMDRTVLLAYTYNMDSKSIVIPQNPNQRDAKPVHLSRNERTGIEFSYSFYLHVHPSTFRQEYGLLHIFHKGYSSQFPLLAPGVYMRSDTNTLRVYMNTYKTWNNYVEVENIPVSKWVHVVVVCKENCLEIYINGNLSKKLPFDGYAPYQNYQDICCFNQRRLVLRPSTLPSLEEELNIFGVTKGLLSRLQYFSYAVSYAEIHKLLNEGPSTKMDPEQIGDVPPYLSDTWWHTSVHGQK